MSAVGALANDDAVSFLETRKEKRFQPGLSEAPLQKVSLRRPANVPMQDEMTFSYDIRSSQIRGERKGQFANILRKVKPIRYSVSQRIRNLRFHD